MSHFARSPSTLSGDDKAQSLLSEHAYLAGSRGTWESHWQEVAERVLPAYSNTFYSQINQFSGGNKKNIEVFDSTGSIALGRFTSIVDSLITPRNALWHGLAGSDPILKKDRETRLYFEEVKRLLFDYRYAPKANFASQNQQNFKSLGAFGTGCLFIDELQGGRGIRYRAIHLGEIYFRENHQGIIDAAYRYFPLTARQAFQQWGDKIPETIKSRLQGSPDSPYMFLHVVKAREDRDPERLDSKGMAFESVYVSVEGRKILEDEGYSSFPYAISRYEQAPGELYGRSPGMEVLPTLKTLNAQKKTILKQGHRAVDPVLLAHDDGIIDTFSLRPGSINAGGVDANGRALIQALPTGNVQIGREMMNDEKATINDAFLVTIFQILSETPTMTATEVLERTREKGILLAPTMGRQQSEYLGPLIEREIDILSRQGLLPPMPKALMEAKGEYTVVYDSPLSRAAKAEEAAGFMRSLETSINIAQNTQNPDVLDHYEWDTIIPDLAGIQGVPERWMTGMDKIMALRQGRAAAAQQAQEVQAAPAAAGMMKANAAIMKASK